MNEKNVYQYALSLTNNKILTFYDVCSVLLKNINCVVCRESASDLLGYSNLGFIKKIHIYTTKKVDKPYLECHIVDDLNAVPYIKNGNIKVSPIEIAIVDMLKNNDTDPQVLYETFAKYYYSNNDSYNKLIIPKTLEKRANHFMEEGRLFYES